LKKIFLVLVLQNKNAFSSLAFRPSDLPVKISQGLDTTCQHGKQPEAPAQVGLAPLR
jgi:hypothetical protein